MKQNHITQHRVARNLRAKYSRHHARLLLGVIGLVGSGLVVGEPRLPQPATPTLAPASAPQGQRLSGQPYPPPVGNQCTPVTPATKIPFIDVALLLKPLAGAATWEFCSDLDYAWTIQSYPNAKFTPERTLEHKRRVDTFLQHIKDYAYATPPETNGVPDWVAFFNDRLGAKLPAFVVDDSSFPDGKASKHFKSVPTGPQHLPALATTFNSFYIYGWRHFSASGFMTSDERSLHAEGLDSSTLCIAATDLQEVFENQPGFVFRPLSVRSSGWPLDSARLKEISGQWSGYSAVVFSDPVAGSRTGEIRFGFNYKPCAQRISISITNRFSQAPKP